MLVIFLLMKTISPAGMYSSNMSPITCTPCPGGTYNDGNNKVCTACEAGKYSGAWSAECYPCPNGTYSLTGAVSCINCESGSVVRNNWCEQCAAGKYATHGSKFCTDCEGVRNNSVQKDFIYHYIIFISTFCKCDY